MNPKANSFFDAIVIGAGTAGCVVASRLSEDPKVSVLLVEAGPDAPPGREHRAIRSPFPIASSNPEFIWPSLRAQSWRDENEARPYIKGFGVGGSSNINGMGADRGLPSDFDEWSRMGARGWDWEGVLPYFKKLEDAVRLDGANQDLHGFSGPLPIHRLPPERWGPFAQAFAESWKKRDYPYIDDYLAEFGDGYAGVPTNSLETGRVSASMTYLRADVRQRKNLKLLSNCRAERLIVEGGKVCSVQIVREDGSTDTLSSNTTVLCAGAIQTPTILMRSGIGPAAHLMDHGLPALIDVPAVGSNLQNHPSIMLGAWLKPCARQQPENVWFLQNWLRFSSAMPGNLAQDMHMMVFNKTSWHALGSSVGAVVLTLLQPYSRGEVRLGRADGRLAPDIRFDMLSDPRDYDRMVSGLRFMIEILDDPAIKLTRQELFIPPPNVIGKLARVTHANTLRASVLAHLLEWALVRRVALRDMRVSAKSVLSDEAALRAMVKSETRLQYHDCGTCRMGAPKDERAVVDPKGRVRKLDGLYVVDSSIFPSIPRGYPHVIVLMAAEKMSAGISLSLRHR